MVVVVVRRAIGVEPALDAFRPVFVVIVRGVFALPQALGHGCVVGFLEAFVERWVDIENAVEMNRVGELVDQDVFCVVGVAGVAEQVFLGATDDRVIPVGSESARAAVPKLGRLEVGVLGDLRGELVVAHDYEAAVALDHVVENVFPVADHFLDEMRSLLQCEVGNFVG